MALSFRTKILIAMFTVVAGVTGATVLVTRSQLQSAWFQAFDRLGRQQMEWFSQSQKDRLQEVRTACLTTARKPALAASLRTSDHAAAYRVVRPDIGNATALGPGRKGAPLPGPAGSGPAPVRPKLLGGLVKGGDTIDDLLGQVASAVQNAAAWRQVWLLDAAGNLIEPPEEKGRMGKLLEGRADKARAFLRNFGRRLDLESLENQAIGIIADKLPADRPPSKDALPYLLLETIFTPVPDPEGGEPLGAIMVGFPLPDFGEESMRRFNRATDGVDFQSGIWLGNSIHTKTISSTAQAALLKQLPDRVDLSSNAETAFEISIDGKPWRVICEVLNPDSPFREAVHVALYSLHPLAEQERSVRHQILLWGGIALAGGLVLAFFLSHGLTLPLRELAAATRRIRTGDFDVTVPVRSKDELGQLAGNFNDMAAGLATGRRYQTLLSQLADHTVAEELINGKVSLGGESRTVTVLFCDIRGFTALSESMPPAEVVALLNEHMTAMTAIVHAHHGVVDKFVGDLIMAIFGAPKVWGDDARLAARAALAMQETRERLNREGPRHLEIGIGVATGEVVAGCMGSETRLDYTVLGARVNLASRLCSAAGPGEVLADDATVAALGTSAQTQPREPEPLKGFEHPVPIWQLLSAG